MDGTLMIAQFLAMCNYTQSAMSVSCKSCVVNIHFNADPFTKLLR